MEMREKSPKTMSKLQYLGSAGPHLELRDGGHPRLKPRSIISDRVQITSAPISGRSVRSQEEHTARAWGSMRPRNA